MITKSESTPQILQERGYLVYPTNWGNQRQTYYESIPGSSRVIEYADGPKYIGFRCNWKECHQTVRNGWSGDQGFTSCLSKVPIWNNPNGVVDCSLRVARNNLRYGSDDFPLPARDSAIAEAWGNVWNNLDLNTSDACLLYSGILQAVPLVGGAFKFVSVMNRAARKLAKSFKKKPFTTVVKSLISLDFIDRFVVSPTIDDARKFLDAHNYVVNVINTAYARNAPLPTAIRQSASKVISSPVQSTESIRLGPSTGFMSPATPYCTVKTRRHATVTSDVFLLAALSYNTDAISPIKLWMNRVGITRPLDSVWDLVPFSFVIDYFTRAGDFISGLSDQMSRQAGLEGKILDIVGAYQQTKCFNGVEYDIDYPYIQGVGGSSATLVSQAKSNGKLVYGSYLYDRTPSNPWAYPLVEESGLFKLNLSTTRLRTLLELIIQAKA